MPFISKKTLSRKTMKKKSIRPISGLTRRTTKFRMGVEKRKYNRAKRAEMLQSRQVRRNSIDAVPDRVDEHMEDPVLVSPTQMRSVHDVVPDAYVPPDLQISLVTHGTEANPGDTIRIPANFEVFLFSRSGYMLNTYTVGNILNWLQGDRVQLRNNSLHELHNKRVTMRSRDPSKKDFVIASVQETYQQNPHYIRKGSIKEEAISSTITVYRGDSDCPNITLQNDNFDETPLMGLMNIDRQDPAWKQSVLNRNFITEFPPDMSFKLSNLLHYLSRRFSPGDPSESPPKIRLYLFCCRNLHHGIHPLPVASAAAEEGVLNSPASIGSLNSQGILHPRFPPPPPPRVVPPPSSRLVGSKPQSRSKSRSKRVNV